MAGHEYVQVKVLKCAFEDYSRVIFEMKLTQTDARFGGSRPIPVAGCFGSM